MLSFVGVPYLSDYYNDELTEASEEKRKTFVAMMEDNLETLKSYDRDQQSESQLLSTDILETFLAAEAGAAEFLYHSYAINQLDGLHVDFPSFMLASHPIVDKEDARAYVARLTAFKTKAQQSLELMGIQVEKEIVPPRWMIQRITDNIQDFLAIPAEESALMRDFQRKCAESELWEEEDSELMEGALRELNEAVYPAYQSLLGFFNELEPTATTDDGLWKLSDGEAFYRYKIRQNTTLDLEPQAIHQLGLSEVVRLEAEMRTSLAKIALTDSTAELGQQVAELRARPEFLFSDTDEGRDSCLQEYRRLIRDIESRMPEVFDLLPAQSVQVERIPVFKEESSPGAYYAPAAMDGSRGGTFYANLRSMADLPKWGMKTLSYHEAVPGHHFQFGVQSELKDMPMFRKILPFIAYAEGWALYTEQLAWEMGFYENDELGNLGRLQAEMFRAVRLVVDSGMHAKKWTREEAMVYMIKYTGMAEGEVQAEIERYIAWPAQALGYKIGMMKILELRKKAKTALGDKFDLKAFHRVMLENGSVPLNILEKLVDQYITATNNS